VNGWTTASHVLMYKYNLCLKKKKRVMHNLYLSFQFFFHLHQWTTGQATEQVKKLGELGQMFALLKQFIYPNKFKSHIHNKRIRRNQKFKTATFTMRS
jgi:hypothetical protein